jgi:hypothetical protein
MGSHQTPLENRRAQALRVAGLARWVAAPGQNTKVPSAASPRVFSTSPETHRRLSPGHRGGILQASGDKKYDALPNKSGLRASFPLLSQ